MNVLINGLGSIGLKHVNAIKQQPGRHSIYALRSSEACNIIEGVKNIFHFDEINFSPDFVIIANPTSLHKEAVEKFLSLNVPLFIEKPVFHSIENIDHLISSMLEVPTYIACNLRFHPAIQFLKEHFSAPGVRINEVNVYCGSYLPEWRKRQDFRKSYSADPSMGGGVHLDLIHEVDYCCWLLGFPAGSDIIRRNVSSLGIESSDYANCRMTYPHFTANIILNYYRRDPKRSIEIVLENDTWTVDLLHCTIKNSSGTLIFSEQYDILDTYMNQMKYFIECISAKQEPMNNIDEAIKTLKIVLS